MRPVVVFDTNVLFSAIGWGGKPLLCLELARSGAIDGVTCEEVLDELKQALLNKTSMTASQVEEVLQYLRTFLRIVPPARTAVTEVSDPGDHKVLQCAMVARADYLLTGDRRHLIPLQSYGRTVILSPSEFLRIFLR